ncbi:predicted protein [Naegleria gruberi]|uniref:Predicted protein n=1 Tax=Naegleria gruberi TaxID=5762 RepID=D2VSD5_NAEGR|nr:uncharacterized protein NAEGRDRAFT_51880 [Naegleria gruberi]EFC40402.1 predicted protein [Naegleria gruberi]|eukprot:XP_002673146.1 predicted protein [Naegleria gruberi strain NEG-M]
MSASSDFVDMSKQLYDLELDYWRSHILYWLSRKFDVIYKGGSTLSKVFHISNRQSKDMDLKLIPKKNNFMDLELKYHMPQNKKEREKYFAAVFEHTKRLIPFVVVEKIKNELDTECETCVFLVKFESQVRNLEGGEIYIDIGLDEHNCVVTRDVRSVIHQLNKCPKIEIDCVHPLETLLEKMDAIVKRRKVTDIPLDRYIRHFYDCNVIIENEEKLDPLPKVYTIQNLFEAKVDKKHIQKFSYKSFEEMSLTLEEKTMFETIKDEHDSSAMNLDTCLTNIITWLKKNIAE